MPETLLAGAVLLGVPAVIAGAALAPLPTVGVLLVIGLAVIVGTLAP